MKLKYAMFEQKKNKLMTVLIFFPNSNCVHHARQHYLCNYIEV